MRTPLFLAFAALAASATMTASVARADDGSSQSVRVHQVARRVVGHCTYEATLTGSYRVQGGTSVRDAIVDVQTRVNCRGEAPREAMQQIYFEQTTEDHLLTRLAEAARAELPGHAVCAFEPVLVRDGAEVTVTDVSARCEPSRNVHVAARTR